MTSFFSSRLGSVDANNRKKMSAGLRLFDVAGDKMGYEVGGLRVKEGKDDTGSKFLTRIRETLLITAGEPTRDLKWQHDFEDDYNLSLMDFKLNHVVHDHFCKSPDRSILMESVSVTSSIGESPQDP